MPISRRNVEAAKRARWPAKPADNGRGRGSLSRPLQEYPGEYGVISTRSAMSAMPTSRRRCATTCPTQSIHRCAYGEVWSGSARPRGNPPLSSALVRERSTVQSCPAAPSSSESRTSTRHRATHALGRRPHRHPAQQCRARGLSGGDRGVLQGTVLELGHPPNPSTNRSGMRSPACL